MVDDVYSLKNALLTASRLSCSCLNPLCLHRQVEDTVTLSHLRYCIPKLCPSPIGLLIELSNGSYSAAKSSVQVTTMRKRSVSTAPKFRCLSWLTNKWKCGPLLVSSPDYLVRNSLLSLFMPLLSCGVTCLVGAALNHIGTPVVGPASVSLRGCGPVW